MTLTEEPVREKRADDDGRLTQRGDERERCRQHGGEHKDVGQWREYCHDEYRHGISTDNCVNVMPSAQCTWRQDQGLQKQCASVVAHGRQMQRRDCVAVPDGIACDGGPRGPNAPNLTPTPL